MIEAKEIRLGNLILTKCDKKPHKVDSINSMSITSDGWTYGFSNIFPIVLTTEILEKCGFDLIHGHWYQLNNAHLNGRLIVNIKDQYIDFEGWDLEQIRLIDNLTAKPFFLHQLQNLYFALTGQELNYTP